MKKNKLRVLQIRGFRGLLLTVFVLTCLIAGFIAFPGFVTMNIWNYFSSQITSLQPLNFYGGTLLWAIVLMSIFITKKKNFAISFGAPQELTEGEVKEVISKIKSQNNPPSVTIANDVDKIQDETKIEIVSGELTSVSANVEED